MDVGKEEDGVRGSRTDDIDGIYINHLSTPSSPSHLYTIHPACHRYIPSLHILHILRTTSIGFPLLHTDSRPASVHQPIASPQ